MRAVINTTSEPFHLPPLSCVSPVNEEQHPRTHGWKRDSANSAFGKYSTPANMLVLPSTFAVQIMGKPVTFKGLYWGSSVAAPGEHPSDGIIRVSFFDVFF